MKKVLIAFDGTQFSTGAFEFSKALNEIQSLLLTGLFMPQLSYANLWSYADAMMASLYVPLIDEEESSLVEKNIDLFKELCARNNIACRVHKDFNDFALPELKKETRFADLLILSSEKFFENMAGGNAAEYMKDALHEAECPVVVIPEKFQFPKSNVIAYDGSASSVHALKQFAYLFPELAANDTMLVYTHTHDINKLPGEHYIEELASQHYHNLSISKMNVDSNEYFNRWLDKNEAPMIVCGSFGRSSFSQMLKKSFASEIIASHQLPVFIAHL
jgi:hypothetical protein